jgi:hypothetical protein
MRGVYRWRRREANRAANCGDLALSARVNLKWATTAGAALKRDRAREP